MLLTASNKRNVLFNSSYKRSSGSRVSLVVVRSSKVKVRKEMGIKKNITSNTKLCLNNKMRQRHIESRIKKVLCVTFDDNKNVNNNSQTYHLRKSVCMPV